MQRNTIVNERTSQEGAHLVVAVAPASTSAQVDGGEKGVLDVDGAADAAVLRVGGGTSEATDVVWGRRVPATLSSSSCSKIFYIFT